MPWSVQSCKGRAGGHERVYLFDETADLVMWGPKELAGPTAT